MNISFPVRIFNTAALLLLLAFMGLASEKASATPPDERMFGPWVVQQSSSAENIGVRVFFSPDGNFFLIDPRLKMGFNGSWVIGRAGLLVTIYGNGAWAKLWDADVSFENNDKMIMEVKESQLTVPEVVVLQRVKF